MPEKTSTKQCRYLYSIIDGSKNIDYGNCGIEEGLVYTISNGDLSAVVSDVSDKKIRPQRRHIAAHQEVLNRLLKDNTVLPFSFGIVANSHRAVKNILSRNHEVLIEQIHRVCDKFEMGLRVRWDVPNIFEYFVNANTELKRIREQFFTSNRTPTRGEKIEIGRMFDRILNESKELYTQKAEDVLFRCCAEIKRNECPDEYGVMNLACLINRNDRDRFEAAIADLAELFDDNFAVDYHGPWSPHNFVDLNLEL